MAFAPSFQASKMLMVEDMVQDGSTKELRIYSFKMLTLTKALNVSSLALKIVDSRQNLDDLDILDVYISISKLPSWPKTRALPGPCTPTDHGIRTISN